jgi:maltose-binding protein MalE
MIPRSAPNLKGATAAIAGFTSKTSQAAFAKKLGIAPVRKDLLSTSDVASPYEAIFNRSAIMAQGILEPDSNKTNDIIKELIDTIVSGQYEVSEAISNANEKISLLLPLSDE